jgi:hypothetical protein
MDDINFAPNLFKGVVLHPALKARVELAVPGAIHVIGEEYEPQTD